MADNDFICSNCASIIDKKSKICSFCGIALHCNSTEEKDVITKKENEVQIELSDAEKSIIASAEFMERSFLLRLGKAYAEGLGVEKNNRMTSYLLYSAAIKGSGEAMYRYARLIEKENFDKSLWWYKQAAKNGSIEAQNTLMERLSAYVQYNNCQHYTNELNELKHITNLVRPFCVEITCSSSSSNASRGTGCIIGPDFILTNAHVILDDNTNQPYKRIMINFNELISEERAEIKVVAYDTKEDIALCVFIDCKLNEKLKYPNFGDCHSLECGDKVFTLGNALGKGLALSSGVVSREVQKNAYGKSEVLQTDMSINGGNSGGALFNYGGEIVGMMTFMPMSENTRAYGMSFAVTSNTMINFIKKLQSKESVYGKFY